MLLLKRNLKA